VLAQLLEQLQRRGIGEIIAGDQQQGLSCRQWLGQQARGRIRLMADLREEVQHQAAVEVIAATEQQVPALEVLMQQADLVFQGRRILAQGHRYGCNRGRL
jgi:hypothetical protein